MEAPIYDFYRKGDPKQFCCSMMVGVGGSLLPTPALEFNELEF